MTYEVSADSDGTITISIAGELDFRASPALEAALAPTLADRPSRIVVDASALEFADSSAIALFVRWANFAGPSSSETRRPTWVATSCEWDSRTKSSSLQLRRRTPEPA